MQCRTVKGIIQGVVSGGMYARCGKRYLNWVSGSQFRIHDFHSWWALWPWQKQQVSVAWFFFSFSGDEEDELFKGATLKVPRPKVQPEEEDEDEVVRKSQTLLSPHTTTWGLFPAVSEKRKGVCWWPTSWTMCTGTCGSELGGPEWAAL